MKLPSLVVIIAVVAAAGCSKLPAGVVVPTPSPSSTPLSACNQIAANTTVVIAMSSGIAPVNDPKYGTLNGFAAVSSPQTEFFIPSTSAPVTAHPSDIVQFANVEPVGSSAQRSAASLMEGADAATAFPAPPYAFSAEQQTALNTGIGARAWSTGRIAPNPGTGYCASGQFTLSAGTWYFGDLDTYNLDNRRGVIVVQ